MRTSFSFFCLIFNVFFLTTSAFAQTINFDETWKEFLVNNKISNMSELIKPNKNYDPPNYAKYLLMNTNTSFCQSKIEDAEELMAEVKAMDTRVPQAIPGFVNKMTDLDTKIKIYHSMDAVWDRFLKTREVSSDELDALKEAESSCEKSTLAKYSYLKTYGYLCQGNVNRAKDVYENRLLKLTEKTTLRMQDVQGLSKEVASMKSMFQGMAKLDVAWKSYVSTGVSPGFDVELPLFPCYPIPNMKALLLNGVLDVCNQGPAALEKIKELQAKSGVKPDAEMRNKLEELEEAINNYGSNLTTLNKAWEAFIPENKVTHLGEYGYEYCTTEPLIRAYIMDGFANVCDMAEDMLQRIKDLQKKDRTPLEEITKTKIKELEAIVDQYQVNGSKIEKVWKKFIAQGDKLTEYYESSDNFCDIIHQVKDWTMQGLSSNCEEGVQYLDKIEAFQRTVEFSFSEELECRVQKLRIKVWDCRYQALENLAKIQAPDNVKERIKELMEEYGMEGRPEPCEKGR